MSAPAVDIAHATKRYGALAVVDDVSLAVEAGESLALLGHNGAGKTTLMKLMLGLTRPSGGTVRILGEKAGGPGAVEARKSIGFLPENVTLHDGMTGQALLRFYARLKGAPVRQCRAWLERVGLAEAAGQRIKTYSKGMRQRLGLAQALLGRPALLLLDEPTSGLDPGARRGFYEIVHRMTGTGATVLLSSHALTEVEARQLGRIAIMKQGRLVACGALDALRKAAALPAHARVTVAPGRGAAVAAGFGAGVVTRVNDHAVDIACHPNETMALVRHIADLDGIVREVEIRPPTLDALYTHYRGEEARP